ncbi:hypothetical protein L1049_022392 [Liquidambar formosana]|uniref:Rad7 n=1 Tax=Liquidambar formosana TaxID=63359 RepID=A0AAP0RCH0_LIQFO
MTVLRSREIVTAQSPPKTRKRVVEPSTPAKTHEPSTHQSSPAMSVTPPSHSPDPNPNLLGLESDPVAVTRAIRRRSLRLASKLNPHEGSVQVSVLVSGGHRKRKIVAGENDGEAESENMGRGLDLGAKKDEVCDSRGKKVRVLVVNEGVKEKKMGLGGLGSVADRVTELGETELGFEEEEKEEVRKKGVRSLGESGYSTDLGSFGNVVSSTKAKRNRKLNSKFSASVVVDEDEGGKGYLNLRSGKRVAKRSIDRGVESDGDDSVHGREEGGIYKEGDELEKGPSGNQNVGVKTRRRLSSEEKGKGKLVTGGLSLNGGDPVEMGLKPKARNSKYNENAGENGPKGRRRLGREEKGKGKLVEDNILSNSSDTEVKNLVHNAVSEDIHLPENVALKDEMQVTETNTRASQSRGRYLERFRDIARKNATRFAHFTSQEEEEEENHFSSEADEEMPAQEAVPEVEDWPGPFSTAMKIIKERAMKLNILEENPSSDKIRPTNVLWVPKQRQVDRTKPLLPSLQELCMKILVKHADAICSLENVPDAMRHRLSQLLCDSRRMNNHFFDLLVCGSPTEIRVRDSSWLTEEQFTKSFGQCDTNKLTVLQLDQCGRCMPDYVLHATLARSLNSLPALTIISLKGACRLSDIGLSALVSSAPALRSINLSQCSLLTSTGIASVADSLGSDLRELYIDDCQNIDAMLVLPALKKLERLEVLSLAGIQTVCDDFVRELMIVRGQSMKELVLSDCVKLTDSSLKAIAETCFGLVALDLVNLCKLTDFALGYLVNGCLAIQTLKLCRNAFSDEAIAAFLETSGDSLKELSLNNVNKVGHSTAISLAKHSRKLLSLDLSWCRNLTNEALGLIVDSCLLLRVLKLFGCTQITNVFLDGHSNPKVQIIGLKMTPILEHLEVPYPQEGLLHYSSVP